MPFGLGFRALISTGVIGPITDDFNRADSASLGVTPQGVPWEVLTGTWSISSNRAYTSTSRNSHPMAAVQAGIADGTVSVNISSGGGDALYFRVVDASNWLRLRYRRYTNSYSCCTQYCSSTYKCNSCGLSSASTCGGIGCNASGTYCSSCGGSDPGCGSGDTTCCVVQSSSTTNCTYCCNSGTCTTWYSYVYLEKSVNGAISQVTNWNTGSGGISYLAAVLAGSSITVTTGNTGRSAVTVTDHQTAMKHGIGRAPSDRNGSALDNFSFIPAAA